MLSVSLLKPKLPVSGIGSAIAQAGGIVSPSNPIIGGQRISFGPLTVANGSGHGYGGTGELLTYQESVSYKMAALLCLTCFLAPRSETRRHRPVVFRDYHLMHAVPSETSAVTCRRLRRQR